MRKSFSMISISILFLCVVSQGLSAADNFYAYYTKVQQSATDYMGKFPDIIVVMEEGKQLEFTRQTGYQPLWKTPNGSFLVDDLFPGKRGCKLFKSRQSIDHPGFQSVVCFHFFLDPCCHLP